MLINKSFYLKKAFKNVVLEKENVVNMKMISEL